MCGENLEQEINAEIDNGSPPRVRGKPPQVEELLQRDRITPACAGKTQKKRVG